MVGVGWKGSRVDILGLFLWGLLLEGNGVVTEVSFLCIVERFILRNSCFIIFFFVCLLGYGFCYFLKGFFVLRVVFI